MPDKLQSGTSAKKHQPPSIHTCILSSPPPPKRGGFILNEAVVTISTHPMARIVARQLLQTVWSGLASTSVGVQDGMPVRHLLLPLKAT